MYDVENGRIFRLDMNVRVWCLTEYLHAGFRPTGFHKEYHKSMPVTSWIGLDFTELARLEASKDWLFYTPILSFLIVGRGGHYCRLLQKGSKR